MFTQGKWVVNVSTDHFGFENYIINQGGIHSDKERKANARLIAASPILLEACKVLLTCITRSGDDCKDCPVDCPGNTNLAAETGKRAIAKAEEWLK